MRKNFGWIFRIVCIGLMTVGCASAITASDDVAPCLDSGLSAGESSAEVHLRPIKKGRYYYHRAQDSAYAFFLEYGLLRARVKSDAASGVSSAKLLWKIMNSEGPGEPRVDLLKYVLADSRVDGYLTSIVADLASKGDVSLIHVHSGDQENAIWIRYENYEEIRGKTIELKFVQDGSAIELMRIVECIAD